MEHRKDDQNSNRLFSMLILGVTPLLACLAMCLKEGIWLKDVYLANSGWNDEVFYYKMIEATIKYGQPLGYFGYNGSTANIGRFGSWSPVLFLFYVLYGKVFGWSMLSPIYCNMILMTVAMIIFACLVRPNVRQALSICLLYCFCTIITRYVFSNMPEISIYALLVIFLGFTVKMLRQEGEGIRLGSVICLNLLAFLLVLMRPYWILLGIVPGGYWYSKSHKKKIILGELIWAFVGIAFYFFINKNFCAAYYEDIINLDWLELLFSHPIQGIVNMADTFVSSLEMIFQHVKDGIIDGDPIGGAYAVYLLAAIYGIYLLLCQSRNEKKEKEFLNIFLGYLLAYFCVMLLAIIYLYDVNAGSRHVMGFVLIFICLVPFLERSIIRYAILLTVFLWIFGVKATDGHTYQIPVYTEEKEMDLQKGRKELLQNGMADLSSSEPWDNTVIWLLKDETDIDFTYLYALPEGMGIELYFKGIVSDSFAQLKPKYILTNIGEEIDLLCEREGKERMAEYGNVHVWKLRE